MGEDEVGEDEMGEDESGHKPMSVIYYIFIFACW